MNALKEAIQRNDGDTVAALLQAQPGLVRDTYYLSDQPTTCPKCGARTQFTDGPQQAHMCGPCDYVFLAEEDPNPEPPMDLDREPIDLHAAALRGDVVTIRQAAHAGDDLDALNSRGMTAAHLALAGAYSYDHGKDRWEVSKPHLAAFHELLACGASVDVLNTQGFSVRQQADIMGLTDLDGPTTPTQLFGPLDRFAAVCEAVEQGNAQALRDNLASVPPDLGQRLRDPDGLGPNLLHVAANKGNAEVLGLLLRAPGLSRSDVLNAPHFGMTPLYMAASTGNVDAVHALLDAGARLDTDAVASPLHVAAEQRSPAVLAALLERGLASPSVRDTNQATPLHVAARKGNTEHCRLLVEAGADLDARDSLERTPRQVAAGNAAVLAAMDDGLAARNARLVDEQRQEQQAHAVGSQPLAHATLEARLAALEAENAQLRAERTTLKAALEGVLGVDENPVPRSAGPNPKR